MSFDLRPYLVIPKLIEQPTWGGDYILKLKGWQSFFSGGKAKIGQSYELFGGSFLSTENDSRRLSFSMSNDHRNISLNDLIFQNPEAILGEKVAKRTKKMPLLIKFTQASGNSFQLHVKPDTKQTRWSPKAESWYYLEDGLLTFGIKKGVDITRYKNICLLIDNRIKILSQAVIFKKISLEQARKEAINFIKETNPWQFVNVHRVKKGTVVDLSLGGIHHSWEEDKKTLPHGNIVYEIQQDVADNASTIRCFDQGKIKGDGSVRNLNIDDYFLFIDTDPEHNNFAKMSRKNIDKQLVKTKYYSLNRLVVEKPLDKKTDGSFRHLFVEGGAVSITTQNAAIKLTAGHSCLIPAAVYHYQIKPYEKTSTVLESFV
ncbi:hypothetical protein GYA28_01745 [Candidatus Roizmanbacteria bacterium]|nr:hypothetical protein [Candidatus Roizmanbacteria bacterium]